jgi:hypothetical protein
MTPDQSICTVPDANGRSVKLEVDPDLFPLSLNLLSTVERSYRDESRSQPFVSPNRPHGVIGQDQIQTEAVPPGVTIHSAAVELPVDVDTEMARAYVLRWSKLANRWDQIYPSECHIRVHDCQVDIRESGTSGDDLMPLLSLRTVERPRNDARLRRKSHSLELLACYRH